MRFIFETKSSLSTPVLIFSTIFQSLKTKFDLLWKETCRNPKSIKFVNFLSITSAVLNNNVVSRIRYSRQRRRTPVNSINCGPEMGRGFLREIYGFLHEVKYVFQVIYPPSHKKYIL